MWRKRLALAVVALVTVSGAMVKAATSEETPETVVQRYLQDRKLIATQVPSRNGEPIQDEPYIIDILFVKAQSGPERVSAGKAQAWRVLYAVETKLPHEFAQRRLAFLIKQRAIQQKKFTERSKEARQSIDEILQGSIERVRPSRYIVQSSVLVNRTATGWELPDIAAAQVATDLHAWALDDYFDPSNPGTRTILTDTTIITGLPLYRR